MRDQIYVERKKERDRRDWMIECEIKGKGDRER